MRVRRFMGLVLLLGIPFFIGYHWQNWTTSVVPEPSEAEVTTMLITEIEALGKMELVKYRFQEVTEVKELSPEFLNIFKLDSDSKAILITQGEAVGCLDLLKISTTDIKITSDTVWMHLPEPELCYYKLDLEKTRLYSVETGLFANRDQFISRAYRQAERQIRDAATGSEILDETEVNAHRILRPMLEELSGKTIIFTEKIPTTRIAPAD
ncbi:DUF4230 domain-containing protein [Tunicatimonas pelagia]|uniref:DUF4230 domain-containing protein n=1 Tax=Tunicatimonas pelagia TaxID=931531 RepID=UPI002666CDD0|nr:DUF4230 domain-containing protein [Tunicatimonas pelagia]WKN41231.1 DUF4230 domain-containing protein [Tunicatimonas pelagia]